MYETRHRHYRVKGYLSTPDQTQKDRDREFIFLLTQTTALPGSDTCIGTDGVEPASHFDIQNLQTL